MNNMTPRNAPAALVIGAGFLAFGLIMILRPANVRASFDRFGGSWKPNSWHPYRMPLWALRMAGALVIAVGSLFFYIAYVNMNR